MVIYVDPVTRKRYSYAKHGCDFQYDMSGDPAVTEEAVPVVGPWEDYTGSDSGVNSRSQQQWAGITNTLEGTDAWLEGAKLPPLDITGNNSQTTRRRTIRKLVKVNDHN